MRRYVYQAESGETADLCTQDVPWLSENPISGTVAPSSSLAIDIGWWANVAEANQPGTYHASLKIESNDPINQDIVLPVTMTVNVPATCGKLQGTVHSLGHCDVNPTLLEGAEVLIEGHPLTLTTGVSGDYALWLEQGDYTVTVSEADHISNAAVVNVTAQTTPRKTWSCAGNGPTSAWRRLRWKPPSYAASRRRRRSR